MTVFILYDFKRVCQVLKDHAFFLCLFNLDKVRRHFVLRSPVNVVDFLCAESYGSSAGVHCGVSAAYDGNPVTQVDLFVSDNLSEKIDSASYAICVLAFAAYAG